jgi:hypothetical protein
MFSQAGMPVLPFEFPHPVPGVPSFFAHAKKVGLQAPALGSSEPQMNNLLFLFNLLSKRGFALKIFLAEARRRRVGDDADMTKITKKG